MGNLGRREERRRKKSQKKKKKNTEKSKEEGRGEKEEEGRKVLLKRTKWHKHKNPLMTFYPKPPKRKVPEIATAEIAQGVAVAHEANNDAMENPLFFLSLRVRSQKPKTKEKARTRLTQRGKSLSLLLGKELKGGDDCDHD